MNANGFIAVLSAYPPHQGLSEGARFLRSLQKIVNLLKVPLDEFVMCWCLRKPV